MKKLAILAISISLSAVLTPFGYAEEADEPFFTLIEPSDKEALPLKKEIRLKLSSFAKQMSDKDIRIELDAIDVSQLVTKREGYWLFQPLSPLSAGPHRLTISVISNSKSPAKLQNISFEIQADETLSDFQFSADTQATVNYRLSDTQLSSPKPTAMQTDLLSQIGFASTQGDWVSQGQFDLYYTSVKENRSSERSIENGEFLLAIGKGEKQLQVGHQNIETTSLVMDNFRRRGLSLQSPIASLNGKITGFSLSSFDISGFGYGIGTTHASRRVDGVSFISSPIDDSPELLSLSATWLNARSYESADFLFDSNISPSGANRNKAWSLAGQSNLLEGQLQLAMEYAKTDFDLDRLDSQPNDQDRAFKISAVYSDITEEEMSWSVGLSKQNVGTFFQSLANQTLAADNDLVSSYASFEWQTLSLQGQIDQQKNNVNHLQDIATIETRLLSFSGSWLPQLENEQSWMGTPSFSFSLADQIQRQIYTPSNYSLPIADNQLKTWQISSDFSYEQNAWGIGLGQTQFRDYSQVQSDSDSLSLSFYANLYLDSDISLSPAISFDKNSDLTLNTDSRSISYSLQSALTLIPDALNTSVSIIYSKDQTSDRSVDGNNMAANLTFSWLVSEANPNEFGIQLDFNAVYNDFEDRVWTLNTLETFQSYLTLTATLPSRIGQQE